MLCMGRGLTTSVVGNDWEEQCSSVVSLWVLREE